MGYIKFWVQALATVLAAVVPALSVGVLDADNVFNVIILAAGAIMVINAANIPGWQYAKLIASAVSAGAVVLLSAWQGGIDTAELIQVVVAVLGALGVGVLPNKGNYALAA